ncbi:hypothetical protein IQ273_12150 [Nodosilinea sp. LEGE 07298]|uniref:hypothetical protein n=1 Tax=Nodosilinea sp. LEGE 07298 TaxID=2777970 RepID=UPI001881B0DF|nr:hypothetical protein [Nodosilinea sp. LEGE 07298]MBE9110163.1 hypothetical protein [Nodosilinea sp. LEGE 07298]
MEHKPIRWTSKVALSLGFGFSALALGHQGFAQESAIENPIISTASQNIWQIAALLSLWLFIPLIATLIISVLAFRISPTEAIEAEGENVIKVLPGLKFKAKGPTATFIILLAFSSLIVLTQIGNVIVPIDSGVDMAKLKSFLVAQKIVDSAETLDIDSALDLLDRHLNVTNLGLNPWTLNTKVGLYQPNSPNPSLMSDSEVRHIVNEKTLSVHVESVPKVEPPFGTNVTIEKLLYFPIRAKTTDDIRKAVEDSSDGVNFGFVVVKPGDRYRYRKAANLKSMSLSGQLDYQESIVGKGSPAICDVDQEKLTLSINFQERRMWLGPCVLLDYESAQSP